MHLVFFGAFSIVAAILFNFLSPKITAMISGPVTDATGTTSTGGFVGTTLVTAVSFFLVLLAAGFLMGLVSNKTVSV
jgi:hypothetical protein